VVSLVAQNPVLLLFGVCAVGFLVGRISFGGFSLGVAAVLFVGIGAGAVSATWVLPEEVWVLGLAVFVYTTGLASGPGFVAAIRRRGLPLNTGAVAAVALAAAAVAIAVETIHATGGVGSGIFAGAVTSTPALAASIGYLQQHSSAAAFARTGAEPIVGYSLCYPLGVLIPLLTCHAILRRGRSPGRAKLVEQTARIEDVENVTLAELAAALEHKVAFGRVLHEGSVQAAEPGVLVHRGDLVTVVGSAEDVATAVSLVGERISTELADDRSDLGFRRVLVSNSELAGRRIDELGLDDPACDRHPRPPRRLRPLGAARLRPRARRPCPRRGAARHLLAG
jgi:putative transport protein